MDRTMNKTIDDIIWLKNEVVEAVKVNDIAQAFEHLYHLQAKCAMLDNTCEILKTSINTLLEIV